MPGDTKWMDIESADTSLTEDVFTVHSDCPAPLKVVRVDLNGKPVGMEIDTGATVSMSKQKFNNLFPGIYICKSKVALRVYTGESMTILSEIPVKVSYQQ